MAIRIFARSAFGLAVFVALLDGCGGGAPQPPFLLDPTSANQNADVYHGVQPRMAAEANYRRAGAPPFQIMPPGSISGERGA